jgi:hypothetical protein
MSFESLLVSTVTEMFGGNRAEVNAGSDLPVGAPSQVYLGKPGEAIKAVRARLAELKAAEQAELQERVKELREEIAAEKEIAASGDFDLKTELKKGTSREELAQMRAAGEIAHGVVAIKIEELEDVNEQIDLISKKWATKTTQAISSIQRVEATYMSYLQAFCGGDRQGIKLNPERQARALNALTSTEASLRATLDDDDLVDSVMAEITTLDIPDNYVDLLWFFITDRDKREHFNNEKPTINYTTDKDA